MKIVCFPCLCVGPTSYSSLIPKTYWLNNWLPTKLALVSVIGTLSNRIVVNIDYLCNTVEYIGAI